MSGYEKTGDQIVYIGSDMLFWKELSGRFRHQNAKIVHTLHAFNPEKIPKLQTVMLNFIELKPKIIYFDLTNKSIDVARLARKVRRDPPFKNVILVALLDQKAQALKFQSSGFDLYYLKYGEYHDMIYHPTLLAYGKGNSEEFLSTRLIEGQEGILQEYMRVDYISSDTLKIESDHNWEVGEIIKLTNRLNCDYLPRDFSVKKKSDENIYYLYKYSYELIFSTDKKKINDWIQKNYISSMNKSSRILIIDCLLRIFKDPKTKMMREYPFSIRCQTQVESDLSILKRFRPTMINIQWMGEFPNDVDLLVKQMQECEKDEDREKVLELFPEDPFKLEKKWWKHLDDIVSYFKKSGDLKPLIVIFNSKALTSEIFQKQLAYKEVMAIPGHMDIDPIVNFITILEKNREKALQQEKLLEQQLSLQNNEKNKSLNFFPINYSQESIVMWTTSVQVLEITESLIILASAEELEQKTYFLKAPYQFMVRLIKDGQVTINKEKMNKYRALINLSDVADKAYFRRLTIEKHNQITRILDHIDL